MTIDIAPLWAFSQPAASEQRFRAALESATRDDALILLSQIARTHGLRKDFSKAREVLKSITLRALGRVDEALDIQRVSAAAGPRRPRHREPARRCRLR